MKRKIFLLLIGSILCTGALAVYGRSLEPLDKGSKGEDVVRLQTRLMDLGYNTYKPTGSYQSLTQRFVQSYQAAAGQSPTGRMEPEALTALYSTNAPIKPFEATIPLTFTAQSSYFSVTGEALPWDTVKSRLQSGESLTVTNCATGAACTLLYEEGSGHAHLTPSGAADAAAMTAWLGSQNSFYKIAVTALIDGQPIAASLQWDGSSRACLYFSGSSSHVLGLSDAEHDSLVKKAAGQ